MTTEKNKTDCIIAFRNGLEQKERFILLKEAIIKTIDIIDSNVKWSPVEPKWWLEMMNLRSNCNKITK